MNLVSEGITVKALIRPASLAAGQTSGRVSMAGLLGLGILISIAPGAITDAECNVTLKQYVQSAGGAESALKIYRYLQKKADQEVFTLVESEEGLDAVDVKALFAAAGGELLIDVKPIDLDHETNGYVGCEISETTAAILATAQALAKAKNQPSYDLAI